MTPPRGRRDGPITRRKSRGTNEQKRSERVSASQRGATSWEISVRCTKVFGRCDGWPYSSRSHCTNRSRFLHICIHQHHIIHSLRGLQIKRTVLCAGAHEGACRRGEQECRRFQHPGCVISQSVTQVSVLTTGVTNNVTLRRQSTYVLRQLENRLASNVSFLGVVLNFHIDDMD